MSERTSFLLQVVVVAMLLGILTGAFGIDVMAYGGFGLLLFLCLAWELEDRRNKR